MTATQEHAEAGPEALKAQPASWIYTKPASDAAALRDIRHDLRRQQEIQQTVNQILAAVGGQPQPATL